MTASEKALHRTIFLAVIVGVVVGVMVTKCLNGWPLVRADGESEQGKQRLSEQAETFREAASSISPTVVAITALKKIRVVESYAYEKQRDRYGITRLYRFPKFKESLEPTGIGSGFIFDSKQGYVMTNDHVISGGEEFIVKLGDKRELSAKLVGADPQTDVAVLKVEPDTLPEAVLGDSNAVAVGDWVIAVGNPFGFLEQTVTAGIISAKGRKGLHLNNYEDFLQTDAAINKGNSGGPLVDLNGQVIGINTAVFSENQGYQGIGFAIPINQAREIAAKLVQGGEVRRGWMGVSLQGVHPEKAQAAGLAVGTGLEVREVYMRGPAYQAGIWLGDIVVKVGDREIKVGGEVGNLVADMDPGEKVKIKILRFQDMQYSEKEIELTLGLQPKDWQIKKGK